MSLIASPMSDRAIEYWLSHLPTAPGEDRSLGMLEIETSRLPIESEEFDQTPTLGLEIIDQCLVIDRRHR